METIFDIATPRELAELLGDGANPYDDTFFQNEKKRLQNNENDNFGLLALLYAGRGEMKLAEKCLESMPDEQMRLDYQLLIYEEVD